MEKQEALQYVRNIGSQKIATREEVIAAYEGGMAVSAPTPKRLGVSEILYYIGGAIVFLGIAILIEQNWGILGSVTQVVATLGVSVAAYIVGLLFSREEKTESVSSAFYLISALTLPIGLGVVFHNAGMDLGSAGVQTLAAGISFAFFAASYFVFRKNVFALFAIIFGTILFWTFTDFMVGGNPVFDWHFSAYRALGIGLSYSLMGYAFARGERAPLTGPLYGFGIWIFLASALVLGGWSPSQNIFWELIFPGIALGVIFLSVHLKSRSFLTFGSLFLMAYILKITGEYFTSGLGWPLALVLAGLMLIAVGYGTVYVKRTYAV